MKTMTIVAVAAALLAGPALAQSTANPAPAAATAPVPTTAALPAPNKTELSKDWAVGQKVPTVYTMTSRYALNDFEQYALPKPNQGSRWILVGDNAYLVRNSSDIITKIVGVTPKG